MAAPDMEVIKEIPGYKVILKAVLKSQIQQLVEQLASHTDEQSVILTASVSDGTLSHLGSDSGKSFLQDHEDIKSQFLGFCLKREHKRKQEEEQKKIEKEREEEMQRLQSFSPRNMGPRPSRFSSPRHEIHPVRLSRAMGGSIRGPGVRHEPYGLPRPRARSLNLGPQGQTFGGPPGLTRMPLNKEVIKVEPTDSDGSNQSAADVTSAQKQSEQSGSQPSSPSSVQTLDVKPEHADDNSTSANDASDMKFSDTQPAEGLGLDSDLSNLISGEQSGDQPTSSVSSDMDPNVNIKLEAISENDMELEITGVEPGMSSVDTSWAQNTAMGYDPSGATGNQADMQGQEGYNKDGEGLTIKTIEFYEGNVLRSRIVYNCDVCNKIFPGKNAIVRHMRLHTGDKPFKSPFCEMSYTRKFSMQTHVKKNHPSD